MAPLPTAERIQRLLSRPREKLSPLLSHPAWRWAWRVVTVLSLAAVAYGVYYSYQEFPAGGITIRPSFLLLAFGIYLLTFLMHLMGWHSLSRLLFGDLGLRRDVEAIAGSNLVKYLPTIAWYIANRVHYYGQHGVPQGKVVAASLYELGFMVGACAALLGLSWLAGFSLWLAGAAMAAGVVIVIVLWALYGQSGPRLGGTRRAPLQLGRWIVAFLWYAATWPLAGVFLWAIVSAFTPLTIADLQPVAHIWLTAALASYAVSLTLGVLAFAREITLVVLLNQFWSLPVALASAIAVKLLLTLGEVGVSLLLIGLLRLYRGRKQDE